MSGLRDRFLAPVEQAIGGVARKQCDFAMMAEAQILATSRGFTERTAYHRNVHAGLITRPGPFLTLDQRLAVAVAMATKVVPIAHRPVGPAGCAIKLKSHLPPCLLG